MAKVIQGSPITYPTPTLFLSDCEELRKSLKKGDDFEIITNVWAGESQGKQRKRIFATIDGVYRNGIQLYFYHRNWRGPVKCYRWLSYKQIIMDRRIGAIPFVDCLGRGANVDD